MTLILKRRKKTICPIAARRRRKDTDNIVLSHAGFVAVQFPNRHAVHKQADMSAQVAIAVEYVETEPRVSFNRVAYSLQRRRTRHLKASPVVGVITDDSGNLDRGHGNIVM